MSFEIPKDKVEIHDNIMKHNYDKLCSGLSLYYDIFMKINLINDGIQNCKNGALQDPAGVAIDNIDDTNNIFIPKYANGASGSIYYKFKFNNTFMNKIKYTETDVAREGSINGNYKIFDNKIIIFHTHSPYFNTYNNITLDKVIELLILSYKSYLNKILEVNSKLNKIDTINFVPISASIYGAPYNTINNHLDPFITLYSIVKAIDELKFDINKFELNLYFFDDVIYNIANQYITKIILLNKIPAIKINYLNYFNKDDVIFYNKNINETTNKNELYDYYFKKLNIYNINQFNNDNEDHKILKSIICNIYKLDKDIIIDNKDITRFTKIIINEKINIKNDLNNNKKQEHWMWYGFPQYYSGASTNIAKLYNITDNEIKLYLLDDYLYDYYNKVLKLLYNKIKNKLENDILYNYFSNVDYPKIITHIGLYYKNSEYLLEHLSNENYINKINNIKEILLKFIEYTNKYDTKLEDFNINDEIKNIYNNLKK